MNEKLTEEEIKRVQGIQKSFEALEFENLYLWGNSIKSLDAFYDLSKKVKKYKDTVQLIFEEMLKISADIGCRQWEEEWNKEKRRRTEK